MKNYNFDREIPRENTGALKIEALGQRYGREDLLPLWVADMDFETPDFIMEALKKRLEHPIMGYTVEPEEYWQTVKRWIYDRHKWNVETEWLTYIPGVVKGIGLVINLFTKPGDSIIVQPPVYHPFRLVPEGNNRKIIYNPLKELPGGIYQMDFKQLEEVADETCKLLILSNPHNPVGIVWSAATLKRLAEFCYKRGILVISDEIHSDMALFGHRHVPFASVSPEAAACSITFAAPSKTFNMAGIVSAYSIVPARKIRDKFYSWLTANEFNEPTMFAPIATVAAFTFGDIWRRQMLEYVEENVRFIENYLVKEIPEIKPFRPQASFLVWLDCRALELPQNELVDLFVNKAKLALNDGAMFGPGGEGFMRLNAGTPRVIIKKALQQLRAAIRGES